MLESIYFVNFIYDLSGCKFFYLRKIVKSYFLFLIVVDEINCQFRDYICSYLSVYCTVYGITC